MIVAAFSLDAVSLSTGDVLARQEGLKLKFDL
jgi:hypothetical protein